MDTPVKNLFDRLWDIPKDKFAWRAALYDALEVEKKVIESAYVMGAAEKDIPSKQTNWRKNAQDYYQEIYGK
jgi:enoyl reductase-like protein